MSSVGITPPSFLESIALAQQSNEDNFLAMASAANNDRPLELMNSLLSHVHDFEFPILFHVFAYRICLPMWTCNRTNDRRFAPLCVATTPEEIAALTLIASLDPSMTGNTVNRFSTGPHAFCYFPKPHARIDDQCYGNTVITAATLAGELNERYPTINDDTKREHRAELFALAQEKKRNHRRAESLALLHATILIFLYIRDKTPDDYSQVFLCENATVSQATDQEYPSPAILIDLYLKMAQSEVERQAIKDTLGFRIFSQSRSSNHQTQPSTGRALTFS